MASLTLKCTLDPISIENRKTVIEGFLVLEGAARALTEKEKAAVDAAKEALKVVEVSVDQAS